MLNTIKELSDLMLKTMEETGDVIHLPNGQFLGTTSGGWTPLLYYNEADTIGHAVTWSEALAIYNGTTDEADLLRYGEYLKVNTFETDEGCYTIRIIQLYGELWFHKMLNGAVVELTNLTQLVD
jgi:hypothetical protein